MSNYCPESDPLSFLRAAFPEITSEGFVPKDHTQAILASWIPKQRELLPPEVPTPNHIGLFSAIQSLPTLTLQHTLVFGFLMGVKAMATVRNGETFVGNVPFDQYRKSIVEAYLGQGVEL